MKLILLQEETAEKHPHIRAREAINRIVLGGSDGVIESIAVTATLNGASIAFSAILLAGFGLAVAGALSMFFASYLSERSEMETLRKDIERERMEIETEPEEERRELIHLLREEGYGEEEVDVVVNRVTNDKDLWLRTQLRLELHRHAGDVEVNPFRRSVPAGIVFFFGAALPLIPYLLPLAHYLAFVTSFVFSLSVLFILGATKFVTIRQLSIKNGLENAALGGAAAGLLYLVGRVLASI